MRHANKVFWCIAVKGKASWLHRCWPFCHVNQEESHVHWPRHRGKHLPPKGNSQYTKVLCWVSSLRGFCLYKVLIWLIATQVKSSELFEEWVSKLRHHRVFRQNEISMYPHERHLFHHHSPSPSLNDSLRKVGCSSPHMKDFCYPLSFISLSVLKIEGYSYQADVNPPGKSKFLAPFFCGHGQVLHRLVLV